MSLRALDINEPLERYLDLKAQIEHLTEELDALKPMITAALMDEPEQRTLFRGHEITLGTRKSYAYSEEVQALEKALRDAKTIERLRGEAAVIRYTSFPVVTQTASTI
ncbi:MAG TPA: hypothetical protein VKP65_13210 [Rhodothermales bacterium]|nr:hypothetical protein [Rhodothermales bacterium]